MSSKRKQRFFYCPKCGGKLDYLDHRGRPRLTCVLCAYVLYENPVVGVAAVVVNDQNQILLGRRKGGRYGGLWCIPCGYVEYEEDVYNAVKREFKEETNLDIDIVRVFTVQSNFHDPENHTVGIWFWARVTGGEPVAGDDLDRVAYFELSDIPPLAFPTDQVVINLLRSELRRF
ncbi:NUDIX hydrolase [Desulfallas sp. Bu1-1]|uniref:NUDIX domain-containing protein n=1 Tax=Desulfallas sp. Bu1-1 TaxID=2787620 RepID=UPI00189EAF4C|nr:NUDIX domain-containing protein [Desulfallas sp. Bu1-1]MBF7082212.1 NUDIX hydrolase [Desulfallas sp. Bu1-1]